MKKKGKNRPACIYSNQCFRRQYRYQRGCFGKMFFLSEQNTKEKEQKVQDASGSQNQESSEKVTVRLFVGKYHSEKQDSYGIQECQ